MSFFKFAFSFLYVRNWHTGERELSRPRITLFCAAFFLIMLALTIISILQAPIEYISP
ncbi:hypothetical protein KC926_01300 [Candidatus Kaiserbacteria bacterium]|nr:hypothetical protein [Candidatus Kaiserbacteria bacterium]